MNDGLRRQKSFKRTSGKFADVNEASENDIDFAGLNSQNIPKIQVCEFYQSRLEEVSSETLPAKVVAELLKPQGKGRAFCHSRFYNNFT
jgi:hypothetical protein